MAVNEDNSLSFLAGNFLKIDAERLTLQDVETLCGSLPSADVNIKLEYDSDSSIQLFANLIKRLCDFGRVTEIVEKELDMVNEEDFEGSKIKACESLKCLIILLQKIEKSTELLSDSEKTSMEKQLTELARTTVVPILILVCEHSNRFMWSNAESQKLSLILNQLLLKICNCNRMEQIFSVEQNVKTRLAHLDLFSRIITEIKPRLKKNVWKKNPSMVEVFSYVLQKVKLPDLSDHLDLVLPPCLNMTDDHEIKHKILGVTCLQHVIHNTSSSELRWYGRAEVIYEALQHQLYTREAALLEVTLPCLISCLKVLSSSTDKSTSHKEENRYDDILQRILIDMEMENILVNRRIYSKHALEYIQTMDIVIIRHLPRLLRVITNYLEISDAPDESARLNALTMLDAVITLAWIRLPNHSENIFKALITLLYDVCAIKLNITEVVGDKLLRKVTNTLILFRRAVPKLVVPWLCALKDAGINGRCHAVICKVLIDENELQ